MKNLLVSDFSFSASTLCAGDAPKAVDDRHHQVQSEINVFSNNSYSNSEAGR